MALAAAKYDEIDVALACNSDNVGLHDSNFNVAVRIGQFKFGGQRSQAPAGSLDQLILYLHSGHERLAHRFKRNELNHMQELDFGAETRRDGLGASHLQTIARRTS